MACPYLIKPCKMNTLRLKMVRKHTVETLNLPTAQLNRTRKVFGFCHSYETFMNCWYPAPPEGKCTPTLYLPTACHLHSMGQRIQHQLSWLCMGKAVLVTPCGTVNCFLADGALILWDTCLHSNRPIYTVETLEINFPHRCLRKNTSSW